MSALSDCITTGVAALHELSLGWLVSLLLVPSVLASYVTLHAFPMGHAKYYDGWRGLFILTTLFP